jgi:hypothetical protein
VVAVAAALVAVVVAEVADAAVGVVAINYPLLRYIFCRQRAWIDIYFYGDASALSSCSMATRFAERQSEGFELTLSL